MKTLTRISIFVLVAIVLSLAFSSRAQAPAALAATPPMGWNSWNHFADKVDDAGVRAAADAIASSGMKAAGYTYVNIDDTWEGTRDASGNITTNKKFPDMKALADYVHSKGLKIGIYSGPGPKTCAGYEGSYPHEEQDAKTYAAWGIDYLKYDLCSFTRFMDRAHSADHGHQLMLDAYTKMHNALVATGRPIVFSLCQYGWQDVWKWGPSVGGNLWRTTGDIEDNYDRMATIGFGQLALAKYAGPGHWNDPDMLEVGNGGMNGDEYRTHMSLWAILAAPLLAGNDLSKMTPETLAILTNHDVIAIDQDPAGHQGDRISALGMTEDWGRTLADGSWAVGIFNRNDAPAEGVLRFDDLGIKGRAHVHDVWAAKDLGELEREYRTQVPAHGVVLLIVKK